MAIINTTQPHDRLESFGIYQLASQLFQDFWRDSEILGKDYRGRELVKQQIRSLDSIAANIEEGYGFWKGASAAFENCPRRSARKPRSFFAL